MENYYKRKVIETIVSDIHKNYETLADILETEYGFPELDPLRYEISLCLLCGFNQAAITLTNHFLESALKKFLILLESSPKTTSKCDISSTFKEATGKYAGMNLNEVINTAYDCGLIDNQEVDMLHYYRKEYRNPYSHANPKQMFTNTPLSIRIVHKDEIEGVDDFYKFFEEPNAEVNPQEFLPIQGIFEVLKSDSCSKDYFFKVDEIIRNIIIRIQENKDERMF